MRPIVRFVSLGIAGFILIVLAVASLAPAPSAEEDRSVRGRGNGDVVLLRCDAAGTDLTVQAFQGSPGTPSKKSGNCAENIALLFKEGFSIRDVGHYDEAKANFVLYTLVR